MSYSKQLFFFYMIDVFNIMCWFNVVQSFLSPLKKFKCCRNFVSSLMFRYWKSLLIMSIQQVFLLPHFFFTLQRYSSSAFFAGDSSSSLTRWPSHDYILLFFTILSISLHLSFHIILCPLLFLAISHPRQLPLIRISYICNGFRGGP